MALNTPRRQQAQRTPFSVIREGKRIIQLQHLPTEKMCFGFGHGLAILRNLCASRPFRSRLHSWPFHTTAPASAVSSEKSTQKGKYQIRKIIIVNLASAQAKVNVVLSTLRCNKNY